MMCLGKTPFAGSAQHDKTELAAFARGEDVGPISLLMPDGSGGMVPRAVQNIEEYRKAWYEEGLRLIRALAPVNKEKTMSIVKKAGDFTVEMATGGWPKWVTIKHDNGPHSATFRHLTPDTIRDLHYALGEIIRREDEK